MSRSAEILFRSVCLGFSAVLTVLALLCAIRTAAWNDRAAQREQEVRQLREENARLRARCEDSLSLAEIERYAREELGMQFLQGEQIVVVETPIE
ncbi:MAG: septum formation initiator family protein [Oscillospiraceae bacterium]|nr:septum formation initiator family protein [Oscillospiraceae bacterium]